MQRETLKSPINRVEDFFHEPQSRQVIRNKDLHRIAKKTADILEAVENMHSNYASEKGICRFDKDTLRKMLRQITDMVGRAETL